ncbi:type IV secretory system conjugative DNA transfer family protein [Bacillus sp. TL12]|uniref:type IV secretory system conjugative DNA transfer family protein n=1 Tax=Bacillus sp. TL12 TaxID=2894756 RepID=UPI001F51E429|nr:type IV secretory system conjugative DNA transfer family protein [Bacillus sp. TL12]MCI0767287.1 type IV secretory system conjugative DNA transfer family protein [Bacillus sp. TL12]
MLIGATEVKFEQGNNSNVYVVGPTGTGKTRFYTNPNVGQEERNIIVIESMKKEMYHVTHQTKSKQGYQVLQLDLLHPYFDETFHEIIASPQQQKFILYIHVNGLENTYQERGEQIQKLFNVLQKQTLKRDVHLYLDEYEMYPIPGLLHVLNVMKSKRVSVSIIVQSHSHLQQIYGKEVANQILENCDQTLFFGTNSMQDAEYFSRISGYDQMEVFLLREEIILLHAYSPPKKIPIKDVEINI